MCSYESSPTGRTLEALEREITQLASDIHAATCRWLHLVAEFDRREGWAPWGCRSCAHWVSWRCGVAPVSAREHVRVAHRLDELPLIAQAFARGQLSYSKVRALTRVGDVSSEAELLELARHATAAQLERLVRAYRGARAVEQGARGGRPERWLTWSYDDDGSLCLKGRLPGEEGALVVAALESARERLESDAGASAEAAGRPELRRGASAKAARPPDDEGASAEAPRHTIGEARADALLMLADTVLAGGVAVRSGGERYQVVVHVDSETLRGPEGRANGAGDRMSDGEAGRTSGACRRGSAAGRCELDDGATAAAGGSAAAGRCELDDGAPLALETARRLACDASLVSLLEAGGRTLDVGRKRRSVPPPLARALAARDRGCRFPGCGHRRFVDAHHLRHWADGGATSLGNLVQLCRHHHRLLHEGGYTVDGHASGALVFRRPDGRRIRPAPRPPAGRVDGVRPRRAERRPEPTACVSLSHGEPIDYGLGVDALLAWTRPPEAIGV